MAKFQIIRELCSNKGISLKELAERSDISEVTLHSIITKNQGRTTSIEAIAHTLNVPVGVLFGESAKENLSSNGGLVSYLENQIDKLKSELKEKDELIKDLLSRIDNNTQK